MRAVAGMIGVAVCASLLSGCGASAGEKEQGALAAARAYVAAIADRDPAAADAMTDADDLADALIDGDTDIRAALVDAVDPITDPWLTLVTGTADDGVSEYSVEVSYLIGEGTGGQTIAVRLQAGGNPSEVDDWRITRPLVVGGDTYVSKGSRVGPVELTTRDGLASIQGYPGGYRAESADLDDEARPQSFVLGADVPLTWREVVLGRRG